MHWDAAPDGQPYLSGRVSEAAKMIQSAVPARRCVATLAILVVTITTIPAPTCTQRNAMLMECRPDRAVRVAHVLRDLPDGQPALIESHRILHSFTADALFPQRHVFFLKESAQPTSRNTILPTECTNGISPRVSCYQFLDRLRRKTPSQAPCRDSRWLGRGRDRAAVSRLLDKLREFTRTRWYQGGLVRVSAYAVYPRIIHH